MKLILAALLGYLLAALLGAAALYNEVGRLEVTV
jgi:hypothetical protein